MKDRRITRTKKAIQNAYLDMLKKKGTEKITISDIAREADIDRKTFYLHYNSTEDIIREYAEEKTRELLARLTIKSFFSLSFDRRIFAREVNSESDLKIQVSFFVAGAMYVYQRWLRDEIPCSMEELGDKVSQIAFTGVQSILRQS